MRAFFTNKFTEFCLCSVVVNRAVLYSTVPYSVLGDQYIMVGARG